METYEIVNDLGQSILLFQAHYLDAEEIYRLFKHEYSGCTLKEIENDD